MKPLVRNIHRKWDRQCKKHISRFNDYDGSWPKEKLKKQKLYYYWQMSQITDWSWYYWELLKGVGISTILMWLSEFVLTFVLKRLWFLVAFVKTMQVYMHTICLNFVSPLRMGVWYCFCPNEPYFKVKKCKLWEIVVILLHFIKLTWKLLWKYWF